VGQFAVFVSISLFSIPAHSAKIWMLCNTHYRDYFVLRGEDCALSLQQEDKRKGINVFENNKMNGRNPRDTWKIIRKAARNRQNI